MLKRHIKEISTNPEDNRYLCTNVDQVQDFQEWSPDPTHAHEYKKGEARRLAAAYRREFGVDVFAVKA